MCGDCDTGIRTYDVYVSPDSGLGDEAIHKVCSDGTVETIFTEEKEKMLENGLGGFLE